MGQKVVCPGCGASVPPNGACRFCRSTVFLDGRAGRLLESDLRCPRCPGEQALQGVEMDSLRADFCPACHGTWFGLGALAEALRTATKTPAAAAEGAEGPSHGGVEAVRYARCPRCEGGMSRVPLCRKPLVIVDRCPSHGDWCDGGEFAQLKVAARTRGIEAVLGPPEAPRGRKATAGERDSPLGGARFPGEGIFTPETEREDLAGGRSPLPFGRRRRARDFFDLLLGLMSQGRSLWP